MIRSLYYSTSGEKRVDLTHKAITGILKKGEGLLWLDIKNEPGEDYESLLADVFKFDPLAIEDALQQVHVPKIDDWIEYIYLVLHSISYDGSDDDLLETQELDIFLGTNYLVTYHTAHCEYLDLLWESFGRDERFILRGPGNVLYHVMDGMADGYLKVIDLLDDKVDEIEQEMFDHPKATLLQKLFTTKRSLLTLRRILSPQREVVNKLARGDFGVLKQKDRAYFRDVYDHYVRLHDIVESMRDLVSGALETYLSVVNNRMNDIMKTLTIITTFFMPMSFVTAFFGMNFFPTSADFAWFTGKVVFIITMLLLASVPLGMYFWLRKKKWL